MSDACHNDECNQRYVNGFGNVVCAGLFECGDIAAEEPDSGQGAYSVVYRGYCYVCDDGTIADASVSAGYL